MNPNEEQLPMNYLQQMEADLEQAQLRETQARNQQMSMFGMPSEDNLIRWQLDMREDLDRLYHLLRGHVIKEDEQGNIIYAEPIEDNMKPFNEFGVQLLMNVMSFYLNRNTLLSNYDEDTINWKVLDFGREVSDLILCRYIEMGMDTQEKIRLYPMIIKELVDTVHSAYLRALDSGERDSLRTARTINQHENIGQPTMYNNLNQKKSLFSPTSWFR
jgi:hypothetical protein